MLLEQQATKIRNVLEEGGLVRIVSSEFLSQLNLSIQHYNSRKLALFKNYNYDKTITLFSVENVDQIQISQEILDNYLDILLESDVSRRFISEDNFCFSKDGTKLATKDLRILIDDLKGIIPKEEMLHIASIASLMLGGLIEYPVGYDYIKDIMLKYGYTEFSYQDNGYLHITIKENQKYKPSILNNPKS